MDPIKFGTDGWRGVMAREFTFQNVRRVAQAISEWVKDDAMKTPGRKKSPLAQPIWIGFDRRFQSDAFAKEIARVLQGNKLSPILLTESLPTPAISLLTHKDSCLGIMVTASHNPPLYNGIKIKQEGRAVPETVTTAVESFLDKTAPVRGSDYKEKSVKAVYLAYLKSKINPAAVAKGLKRPAVIDYMHGAASGLMEELLPPSKIKAIRSRHDPLFGGTPPEPIEQFLGPLMAAVKAEKALIGIALDGDGDRVGLVDDKGQYYTPCQVFPMIIDYLITKKGFKGKIVQSVSMGYLSGRIARALGFEFQELPVGFKHVAAELAAGTAVIGGEESGGYAWKGCLPERDGILAAMLLLEMCAVLKKTPSQIWKDVETKYGKSSFKRIDVKVHRAVPDKAVWAAKLVKKLPKKILGTEIKELIQVDGLKIILQGDHWILVRPSGTEPLMRLYAESDSPARTAELLELAKKWVGPAT